MKNNPEQSQQKEQPEVLKVLELMGELLVKYPGFHDECVEKLSNAYGPRPKDNDELMQALGMSPDDEPFSWGDILEIAATEYIPTMDDVTEANRAIVANELGRDIVRLGLTKDATWVDVWKADSAQRDAETSQ